jgi:hypothetical protein
MTGWWAPDSRGAVVVGGSIMVRSFAAAIAALVLGASVPAFSHGGGLNTCGCHFNRKTGRCHCHQDGGCGCACQPNRCGAYGALDDVAATGESLVCAPDAKAPAPESGNKRKNPS